MAGAPLRVLVVWEPVLLSDVAPPISAVLSLVADGRAVQFWDEDRALSSEMLQAAHKTPAVLPFEGTVAEAAAGEDGEEEELIVWDYVAVYPPGARWEGGVPVPIYGNAPVVHYIEQVRKSLLTLAN